MAECFLKKRKEKGIFKNISYHIPFLNLWGDQLISYQFTYCKSYSFCRICKCILFPWVIFERRKKNTIFLSSFFSLVKSKKCFQNEFRSIVHFHYVGNLVVETEIEL